MKLDTDDRKLIANFFMFAIVATFIYLLIISYVAVYQSNNSYCGSNRYGENTRGIYTNTTTDLNTVNSSYIQEFYIDDEDNIAYSFCYDIILNSSNGVKIQIIDELNTVYGLDYLYNQSNRYCTNIDLIETRKQYLGIKCLTCSASDHIKIRRYGYGDKVTQIQNENTIIYDTPVSFRVVSHTNCFGLIKIFTAIYLCFLAVLMLLLGIVTGHKKLRDMALNED